MFCVLYRVTYDAIRYVIHYVIHWLTAVQNRHRLAVWVGFLFLVGGSLACSAGGLVQRTLNTPVPTRALLPTYTATPVPEEVLPQIIVTPPRSGTPGVIILPNGMDPGLLTPTPAPTEIPSDTPMPDLVLTATADQVTSPLETPGQDVIGTPTVPDATPTFEPTVTPTPTETPTSTATDTPTPLPTPYVIVESGVVSLRTGPGVEYPLAAQLGPRIPIAITGQNPEGTWYRLCCVNRNESSDGTVWVVSNHVKAVNDVRSVALVAVLETPPTATPTAPFTPTPTITATPTATAFPFERAIGPQFFRTCNPFLTIWVKLFVGTPPDEAPLGGYYLEVLFGDDERPSTNGTEPSAEEFFRVSVPGTGYGDLTYNLKYEYRSPTPLPPTPCPPSNLPSGDWQVYVVDEAGNVVSDTIIVATDPNNPFREVYIAWKRVR